MSRPATRFAENEIAPYEDGPEPNRRPPVRTVTPLRPRRSTRDLTWVGLAMLGLVLGGVAVLWFLSLNRSSPPTRLTVPRVVGLSEAAAVKRLTTEGFDVRAVEPRRGTAVRVVVSQRPSASAELARGATVLIRIGAPGRA